MKLTTIFCIIDDFCKEFEAEKKSFSLNDTQIVRRRRSCRLSESEVLTILIYFHHSGYKNFKQYYNILISFFLKDAFRKLVSYNRFIEIAQKHVLALFTFAYAFGAQETGIYYIDSSSTRMVKL